MTIQADSSFEVYTFSTVLWRWEGHAVWYFLTVPLDVTEEIDARYGHQKSGFRSLPVHVAIGSSTWESSIFKDASVLGDEATGLYLIPVKSSVRKQERIDADDSVQVTLRMRLDSPEL